MIVMYDMNLEGGMNETLREVRDRHFYPPLTDEELIKVRVQAALAGLKIKDWVSLAIKEKLERGKS